MIKDTPTKPFLGINQDSHLSEQPENTLRFALNAIKDIDGNYTSEKSTSLCLELPVGYNTVGSVYLDDGDKVICVTNEITSKILLLTSNCKQTELVSSDDIGFSVLNKPVTGEYRIRNGCSRTIYLNDGKNRDLIIDIDDLESTQTDGVFDINKARFRPNILIPNLKNIQVNNTGGNLASGVYRFQIEYVDSNGNSFYRSHISQPVNIFRDSTNNNYQNISGNYNVTNFLADVGGEPNTNKSITLNLENLDTTFEFIKINVFRNITGIEGGIDSHSINVNLPIQSSTFVYNYTGYNPDQGDILEDVNDLLSLPVDYESSLVMEQVQDRLVRANLKQFTRDYSTYQTAVNNITASWTTDMETPFAQNENHNPKSYKSYLEGNTFIGDEIYAVAFSFVYEDGSESPTFHKPGRASTSFDKDLLTVGTNISLDEVAHLGLMVGDQIERYKVFNTGNSTGSLAYHESSINYPFTKDCDGNLIYGDLAGTPIRHHRMPSRKIVPIQTTLNNTYIGIQHLGLDFDNIVYPDPDIVGHKIHIVKHTENNRTILDTGLLTRSLDRRVLQIGEDNAYTIGQTIENNSLSTDPTKFGLISPRILLGEYLNTDYLHLLGRLNRSFFLDETKTFDTSPGNSRFIVTTRALEYINSPQNISRSNVSVNNSALLSPRSRSTGIFDLPIKNESYSNYLMAIDTPYNLSFNQNTLTTVSIKNLIDPFVNLDSLIYYPITEVLTLSDSQKVFNGGGFMVEFEFMNTYSTSLDFDGNDISGDLPVYSDYINKVWLETTFNYNLLNNGTDCNARYVQGNSFGTYLINKFADPDPDSSEWIFRGSFCPEAYNYNPDFNQKYSLTPYLPIPSTFNYCNKCIDKNPVRIIFSPKSFQEERTDYYRVNYIDDYIDLPNNRGEITGIKYKNNKLYVHTTQTTFILQPNPQFIATDQNSAYLNTGDFLSIPPGELMQTDVGYGGMQNKLANVNTEWGYLWLDSYNKKIYRLTDSIEEISRKGLFEWHRNNLVFELDEFYKKYLNKPYPYKDHSYYESGIGAMITYDYINERFIITKKDYKVKEELFESVTNGTSDPNISYKNMRLYIDSTTDKFYIKIGTTTKEVVPTNTLYFCANSWTESYTIRGDHWVGWHSYIPNMLFFDNSFFYTTVNNKIFKHDNKEHYLNFYDKNYEFIIEYVSNDYVTDIASSVQYYADFTKNGSQFFKNYTNLLVYNSNQSTGKLNLINSNQVENPYEDVVLDSMTKSIITTNKNSKITNLWDNSISNQIFTSDCRDIGDSYIDKIPTNIDFNKSAYFAGELKDKFLVTRLFYYPDDNEVKVKHIFSNTKEYNSIR